jgi:cytolysin-activating lysine-acyltransferase
MIFGTKKGVPGKAVQSPAATDAGVPPPSATAALPRPKVVATPASAAGDARQLRMAQSFSQVVSVLMRDPSCKNLKLSDLEWLVLPPVMAGQFRIAHAARPADAIETADKAAGKEQRIGAVVPVTVALWARVSPLVDKALSETLDRNVRLSPGAWTSGDILWLLAVAGHPRAVPAFLQQLRENEFKGKQVKMRLLTPDGKVIISNLDRSAKAA